MKKAKTATKAKTHKTTATAKTTKHAKSHWHWKNWMFAVPVVAVLVGAAVMFHGCSGIVK
jgi:hypothetical protein